MTLPEWLEPDGGAAEDRDGESVTSMVGTALLAGTEIATAMGWRRVEAMAPGDKVLTFDRGLCPVVEVIRHPQGTLAEDEPTPAAMRPLHVPAGLVGNEDEFDVLPGAHLMIESEVAEALLGDPFLLIPAGALMSRAGVEQAPAFGERPELVSLVFEEDEVIFLRRGGMQLCPSAQDTADRLDREGHVGPTAALTLSEARDFLAMSEADSVTVGPGRPLDEKRKAAGWRAA